MSKPTGRPKALAEDTVLVKTHIPWEHDVALNAVVGASGLSKASLLRLFIETGLSAYIETSVEFTPSPTPTTRPRGAKR